MLLVVGAAPAAVVREHTLILADGSQSVYPLEHDLLLEGTDSVFVDGRPLGSSAYVLDYDLGLLLLGFRPEQWSTIRVSYARIPWGKGRTAYRLRTPVPRTPAPADSVRRVVYSDSATGVSEGDLDIGGSKTIGFSVGGPTGSGISQATRLTVSGSVEGIDIEAELSDQSSPIPPEGTTREIEELDNIAISASGRGWRGSFGDLLLNLPAAGFGRLERRAVGGHVGLEYGPAGASAGYARPKGQYGSMAFRGVDGVQGPYILAPDRRSARIVPGSEEIDLDGVRLTRGWDQDYTIDYSTGELVFTNRRPIDRLSRVEARFQYVTEEYERADIVGAGNLSLGPLELAVGVFREGDNPDRPVGEPLSAVDREYLAGIGADSSRAWLRADSFVGSGNGDYAREDEHFRFVGPNQGDYRVGFTFVGDSAGDYVYNDTLLGHVFVGDGNGDYVPRVRVALPDRLDLIHARLGVNKGGGSGTISGLYRRDSRNLFALDGASQDDGAGSVILSWGDERYRLGYQGRYQTDGFEFPGADTTVDFDHRWGGTSIAETRLSNELSLSGTPLDSLDLLAEAGVLHREDGEVVQRYRGRARCWWASAEAGRAGTEDRLDLALGPVVWWFRPRAGFDTRRNPSSVESRLTGAFGFVPPTGPTIEVSYRHDAGDDTDSIGGYVRARQGGLARAEAAWSLEERYRLSGQVGRQHQRYLTEPRPSVDWVRWFADLTGTANPVLGVRLQADVTQSNRLVQLKDELFRYVGPNQGDYRRDSLTGRYYYDPEGNYERVVVATDRFESVREHSLVTSGELSRWRPFLLTGSLTRTAASTDTSLLQNLTSHNLRLTVREFEPVATFHLSTTGTASLDRTLAVTGRQSTRLHHYLEGQTARIPGLHLRARGHNSTEKRTLASGVVDYEEENWGVEVGPVLGGRLQLELLLGYDVSLIEEPASYPELGRFELETRQARLTRDWRVTERTRLETSVGLVQRVTGIPALPFDIELTRPRGLTPSATLEAVHVFSRIVTASVRYSFQDRPDRDAEHEFSGEIKAFF